MPDGNVSKIFKGRDVLLGDNVRDEESQWAVFSDLGSSPPTLEACRNLDALSRLPDYETWTGDANGAYCQLLPRKRGRHRDMGYVTRAPMAKGVERNVRSAGSHTWCSHSTDTQRPANFGKMIVLLVWKGATAKQCASHGQTSSGNPRSWLSCSVTSTTSGSSRKGNVKQGLWSKLKAVIDMGEEEPEASFLGCKCTDFTTCSAFQVQDILLQHPAYHRRPHLTKEDCNCELPEWIVDPKTHCRREGLRDGRLRRLMRGHLLRACQSAKVFIEESRDAFHRRSQRSKGLGNPVGKGL